MSELKDHPEKSLERLQYLEMRLAFLGEAKRRHLAVRFGVKSATCSRDIAMYSELNPGAITYDLSGRCYRPSPSFIFLFEHNIDDVFTYLATGIISVDVSDRGLVSNTPLYRLPASIPDMKSCIAITQGLYVNSAVEIVYVSKSSGEGKRTIVPHCLFRFNDCWYVRAFDLSTNSFRTFNLSRVKSSSRYVTTLPREVRPQNDRSFIQDVEVSLLPHPKLIHKEAVELEYGMTDGQISVKIREGMLGYLMQQWRVDCSSKHRLDPNQFPLALSEPEQYLLIESFVIAPK